MATSTRGLKALALVVILLCSTSLSLISGPPLSSDKLLETPKIANTGIGVVSEVLISSAGVVVNGPSLTVPADESIQSLDLTISAESEIRATGFEWSDWTQSGMNTNDLALEADGSLILGFSGILWNFDKNNDGWTFSNSYSGRSTTACGYNGTTGGSIRTYAGSTYATSPVTNLQGRTSADFHAWVRQGSYTCGEEPDSNENFYFQYRTTSNSWTTFSTWSGAPASNNTGFQVTHSLPQAALHSNTQFRAYQNSGSGTCCDYWYFDDVLIPGGGGMDNLTTRSFGWSNNAHEQIEEGPYPPLYLDADIPYGAFLNWTIIDADTNNPLEGVHVYYNKQEAVEITDKQGNFSIKYRKEHLDPMRLLLSHGSILHHLHISQAAGLNSLVRLLITADFYLIASNQFSLHPHLQSYVH